MTEKTFDTEMRNRRTVSEAQGFFTDEQYDAIDDALLHAYTQVGNPEEFDRALLALGKLHYTAVCAAVRRNL